MSANSSIANAEQTEQTLNSPQFDTSMADPNCSDSVAPSSTPRDNSDAPLSAPGYDVSLPERRRSFITDTAVPWDQPQIAPGEQNYQHDQSSHLDPAAQATPKLGSDGGSRSTIHDLGQADLLTRDEHESDVSPSPSPVHARSPSESRRSTAELVAQTGAWRPSTRAQPSLGEADVASGQQAQGKPLKFEIAIRAAFLDSASKERRQFLPNNAFKRIVTRDRVRQELARLVPYDIPEAELERRTNEVWETTHPKSRTDKPTTRRKIFTILALIEKVKDIVLFIDESIHDNDLPFLISNGPTPGTRQLNRKGRDGKSSPISIMSSWPTYVLEAFNDYQWKLLAPYFTLSTKAKPTVEHFFLDDGIILPFILDHEIASGGYGEVRKVQIHPAHHNCSHDAASDEHNPCYAVKQLRHDNPKAFKAEVSNLKRFSSRDHLHLIKLLVTFQWRDQYYLLFPYADGNLLNFWMRHPTIDQLPIHELPRDRRRLQALWFSGQCLGLAEGLKMIHMFEFRHGEKLDILPAEQEKIHGRHGDLKPENILYFRSIGAHQPGEMDDADDMGVTLKISDFGLTKFHRTVSVFSKNEGNSTPVSLTYRAPEYDIEKWVHPSYDIWSLGCVLLEFVVWYIRGWGEVDKFSKRRTEDDFREIKEDSFFNNVEIIRDDGSKPETGAQAKKSVADEFQVLYEDARCSDFVCDLLDFIETKLLRMGPGKRANSEEIVKTLGGLNNMCKKNPKYCTERTKRSPNHVATNLSLLAASALPYSDEQKRRIRQNTLPGVLQRDQSPTGRAEQLDRSPFDSLHNQPSVSVPERVNSFLTDQRSTGYNTWNESHVVAGPSRQPRSPSPMRPRFPSVTVTTPYTNGLPQTLIQSPTVDVDIDSRINPFEGRDNGLAQDTDDGQQQREQLATKPSGQHRNYAPLDIPASCPVDELGPLPNPDMVVRPGSAGRETIRQGSTHNTSNTNTIRGSDGNLPLIRDSISKVFINYGTINVPNSSRDAEHEHSAEGNTGGNCLGGLSCFGSSFSFFRISTWFGASTSGSDSQGHMDGGHG